MNNAIAIDNNHLTMNDTARTISGDHESRVSDTGTSIVQTFCKTGHAVNAQGDGEKYASSSSSSTLNTFENHTEGRAVDIVVSPAVCKTLSAEGFDGMPDIQKGNGQPVIAVRTANTHASGQAVAVGFKPGQSGREDTGSLGAQPEVVALEGNGARPSHKGAGFATDDASFTLNTIEQHAVAVGKDRASGQAVAVGIDPYNAAQTGSAAATLGVNAGMPTGRNAVAVGFKAGQSANGGLGAEEECCPTQSHQPSSLEPTVAIGCDRRNQSGADEVQPALQSTVSDGGSTVAVGVDAYNQTLTGGVSMTNTAKNADPHHVPCVSLNHIVRRLTPTECERLQGFPDGWTRIPYRGKPAEECPDSPRYKALGNSFATNCCEYVLRRIVAALQLDMIPEV